MDKQEDKPRALSIDEIVAEDSIDRASSILRRGFHKGTHVDSYVGASSEVVYIASFGPMRSRPRAQKLKETYAADRRAALNEFRRRSC